MIDFDTSRLPRGQVGWGALVAAIVAADPADESEWIEFKAGVDVTKKAGQAALARAIVAFANRDPARAARWVEGHGLVMVGVEPANLVGVAESMDPAKVHDGLARLLSSPAPGFDIEYVKHDGHTVLVLIVEPPQEGDPIHCIAKESLGVRDGDVYVRRPGKSEPATSADLTRLSERLLARAGTGDPRLDIDIEVALPDGLCPVVLPTGWPDSWQESERARLEKLEEKGREARKTRLGTRIPDFMLEAAFLKPEDRTRERYAAQIDQYISESTAALERFFTRFAAWLLPELVVTVINRTDHNYPEVQVELHLDGPVDAHLSGSKPSFEDFMPAPPRIWGPRSTVDIVSPSLGPIMVPRNFGQGPGWEPPMPEITNGGSARIVYPAIDVRPHQTISIDHQVIPMTFASAAPEGGWTGTWKATSTGVPGQAQGSFTLPAGEEVDLATEVHDYAGDAPDHL